MGMSTPKPPFDLAAFLAEKAPAATRRKPSWNRPRPAAPEATDDDKPDGE